MTSHLDEVRVEINYSTTTGMQSSALFDRGTPRHLLLEAIEELT